MKFSIARIIECPNTKAAKYAFTLIELLIVMSLAGLLILAHL
jgi:prepilin-type N-terminal cleavage/methylation domain-containing protein